MHPFSLSTLLGSMAVAALTGFGAATAWLDATPVHPAYTLATAPPVAAGCTSLTGQAQHSPDASAAVSAKQAAARPPSLLDQVMRINPQLSKESDAEAFDRLQKIAASDAAARLELIRDYETAAAPHRSIIKKLLFGSHEPEVRAFSLKLLNSASAQDRKDGFDLLAHRQPTDDTYQLARQAVMTEQDPAVLSSAIAALQAPSLTAPAESQAVVSQLRQLMQHSDAAVRRESLQVLAQWDRTEKIVTDTHQALSDNVAEVRKAALSNILSHRMRSDNLKTALMGIIENTSEDLDITRSALRALEIYQLNSQEYAAYSQASSRSQVQ